MWATGALSRTYGKWIRRIALWARKMPRVRCMPSYCANKYVLQMMWKEKWWTQSRPGSKAENLKEMKNTIMSISPVHSYLLNARLCFWDGSGEIIMVSVNCFIVDLKFTESCTKSLFKRVSWLPQKNCYFCGSQHPSGYDISFIRCTGALLVRYLEYARLPPSRRIQNARRPRTLRWTN